MAKKEIIERILIPEKELMKRVEELGEEISRDFEGQEVLLVGLLKGSVIFLADLARKVTIPCMLDFMSVTSYGNDIESSGEVRFLKDLDSDINGKNVIIVEDIIDTGLTLREVLKVLKARNPKTLKVCTLLNKVDRRLVDVNVDYNGFNIPDAFVVGYGLDYAQKYRNLNYIGILKLVED
ncbi:hypoxanthine phosphoribosyltransferase [Thermotomaculum hydrothermale]|uniref:Hypoxanthine phosphoribosyltransferase n=1 Tax=Thermotomaculum hydrothermale TaxID=981385 RepID=A0A7R6PDG7_9BACT|nr:hypoxanthine phosphoribosyltransferase [Thermotomaculum hydrothermale]BBB31728.1 hypoxanthine phosphoribosyltransferase [Thermotomaculum hydrothermale]